MLKMSGRSARPQARESDNSAGDPKSEPAPCRNYFITGRDVCVVKIKQQIETMRPTAPEELGSTSFIERMGDTAMICSAVCGDPGRYIDHLIKHEKHKVLLQEVVMIAHWLEEVLPALAATASKIPLDKPLEALGGYSVFFGSAPAAFVLYRTHCCKAVTTTLGYLHGIQSLGTGVLDVIDVSLLALREFMTIDHQLSPCSFANLLKTMDPVMLQELEKETDYAEYVEHFSMCSHKESGEMAYCGVENLLKLVTRLDDLELPQYVLTKLIHPDTRFIPTVLDLIEQKPWGPILKYTEAEAVKLSSEKGEKCKGECRCGCRREDILKLHTMESKAMELLSKYSKVIYKTFPRDVAVAHLMPREYSGQLLKLMNKCVDNSVGEARKKLEVLTSTACPELNWTAPEPSPYHINVRAELAERKEAIIKIHRAMDTFETKTDNIDSRMHRDIGFLSKTANLHMCSRCRKPEARLRCSRCQVDYYCNRKCQSKHWATHKLTCEEPKARRERENEKLREPTTSAESVSEFARGYFSILF